MLNQASTDRLELAKLLNISDLQMSYITNVGAGQGLLKVVEVQCIRTNTLGQIKTAHTKRFTIIFVVEISRSEDIIVITRHRLEKQTLNHL